MEIMQETDLANKKVIEIRDIRDQLLEKIEGNTIKRDNKLNQILSKLDIIESSIYQVKNQSGQDPLNFPIKVNNRLAYLRKSVESGDGLPTKGSIEVFNVLKEELSGYVSSLDKVKLDLKKYL